MRRRISAPLLPAVTLMLATAFTFGGTAAHGAAFGIFEQGSKAMGMAGAFTAQADDPSAMFHNLGGVAFFEEQKFSAGLTYIGVNGSRFQGENPFPGEGYSTRMEDLDAFPPHIYYIRPLTETWNLGLALNSPFGLKTEWENPNDFAGRYISQLAELTVIDLNAAVAWRPTPNTGIGFGVVGRFSTVELQRRIPTVNPFTFGVVDAAGVQLESDRDSGIGWNVGFLHKLNQNVSFGVSYRSKIEIDYGGDGAFSQVATGNPQLDAAIAATLPIGSSIPVETSVEFPDQLSVGLALRLTHRLLTEVDVNWTGWSSFDVLPLTFPSRPDLSSDVPQNYEDAYNYRIGFRYDLRSNAQLRFGFVLDESPQPDESVGPLLPDAERKGFTFGYGTASGLLDFAVMYLDADKRSTSTNRDGFNGTYETDAWLVGLTLNW